MTALSWTIAAIGVSSIRILGVGDCVIGDNGVPIMRDARRRPLGRTQRKAERASVLIRHTRQRVRRLNAVARVELHSAFTLAMPRSSELLRAELVLDDGEERFDQRQPTQIRLLRFIGRHPVPVTAQRHVVLSYLHECVRAEAFLVQTPKGRTPGTTDCP